MSYRLVPWVPEVRFVGRRPKTRAAKPREKTRAQSSLIYACFSRGSLFKTWPKPETAHEKPLAPRARRRVTDWQYNLTKIPWKWTQFWQTTDLYLAYPHPRLACRLQSGCSQNSIGNMCGGVIALVGNFFRKILLCIDYFAGNKTIVLPLLNF